MSVARGMYVTRGCLLLGECHCLPILLSLPGSTKLLQLFLQGNRGVSVCCQGSITVGSGSMPACC